MDSSVPFVGLWNSRFRLGTKTRVNLVSAASQYKRGERAPQPVLSAYTPPHVRSGVGSRVNDMKIMRGESWTADNGSKLSVRNRGQPYIMPSGHISGSVYFTWRCTAYQWFATTVRAVIERIRARNVVYKVRKRKTKRHLTMIALLYVATNDEVMLERLLNCNRSGFTRTFFYYLMRVDAKTRFLYDQALNGASWFELRGRPRVQSTKKTVLPQYRHFGVRNFDSVRDRREKACQLANQWLVNRNGFTSGMAYVWSPWGC